MASAAASFDDAVLASAQDFANDFNASYSKVHAAFEDQFWGTKMGLKKEVKRNTTKQAADGEEKDVNCGDDNGGGEEGGGGADDEGPPYSAELLSKTKREMEDLLSDPEVLEAARGHRAAVAAALEVGGVAGTTSATKDLTETLDVIIKTCSLNSLPTSASRSIRRRITELESKLEMGRNHMTLGYADPASGEFVPLSSVGLRNLLRTHSDEDTRRAAYEGLRSIGQFVCDNGFPEIVRLRNELARELGYEDYYDYKVSNAEGFGKRRLFEILDGLEESTRTLMLVGREELRRRYGEGALEPWNTGFVMAGDVVRKMDPYFPFSKAVERYLRTYSALGITYASSTMTLDLLDRPGKYSNGFCHWPVPAYIKPDGTRIPSVANFTSLADPTAVGSGLTALTTLMHEAGHAAHFANISMPSPLFSQERAPTSVAYAENQSMFLDSLVGDAAWRARYARHPATNRPMPFDIIEEEIRCTQPFAVFALRSMLSVSYYEKALYELPQEEVTMERMMALADEVEGRVQGGLGPRPLLSVPHLVSDEASCYYQGYILAEMSVHQTRQHIKRKYGYIVDNPNVGPTLTSKYWRCGNSRPFLDLVRELTGRELSGEAWTESLKEGVEDKIGRERVEYEEMVRRCAEEEEKENEAKFEAEEKKEEDEVDLDMTVRFVDGDVVISDSATAEGGLLGACREFEIYVAERVARGREERSSGDAQS